jgi:GT2 family glycosyltransferase
LSVPGKGTCCPESGDEISIIVCSIDDAKFIRLRNSIKKTFSHPVQLIRIADAKSLAEGYNRGIRCAEGKIIIFCHDDIEFVNNNVADIIKEDLNEYDVVGVAGTSRLTDGAWISAGQPYVHGQVAHGDTGQNKGYNLCVYGLGRDDAIVPGIQALDGLFFAVNRQVVNALAFDEALFDGFHLYDLDFTYSAYLKGYRIAVDHRINLIHYSGGKFDHVWKNYVQSFNRKYANVLPREERDALRIIRGIHSDSKKFIESEMTFNLSGHRIFIEHSGSGSARYVRGIPGSNHRKDAVVTGKGERLPFADSSVNYLCWHYNWLTARERNEDFREIFRVCRHSAIVELIPLVPGRGVYGRKPMVSVGMKADEDSWPRMIRFENGERRQGALVSLRMIDSGTTGQSACFQVDKKRGA